MPSELMISFTSKGNTCDLILKKEISQIPAIVICYKLVKKLKKNTELHKKHKEVFDKQRKTARKYKERDLMLRKRNPPATGTRRKLVSPYVGLCSVKKILPNDNYIV